MLNEIGWSHSTEHYDSESGLSLDMAQIRTATAAEFDVCTTLPMSLDAHGSIETETTAIRSNRLRSSILIIETGYE